MRRRSIPHGALIWILAAGLGCAPRAEDGASGGEGTGGGLPDLPCEAGDRFDDEGRACVCETQNRWVCVGPYDGPDDVRTYPLLARFHFQVFVDDSIGMAPAQGRLARAMDALAARLAELDLDFSVGVTTTDAGLAGTACPGSTPGLGMPRMGSCRERLDGFVPAPGSAGDPAAPCTEACTLDALDVADEPGFGAPTHMLTSRAGVLNVTNASDAAQALRCMVPQGNDGCDLSQPLAALELAFAQEVVDGVELGAREPVAARAAVVLTDGVDCSVQDPSILDPSGAQTFWPDPQASTAPPAVCWNAGVACTGGPGSYDGCAPVDRNAAGDPAPSADDAALRPVSELAQTLSSLELTDLLVLSGVPEGYPGVPVPFADAGDPDEQGRYGVGPGCTGPDTRAQPPVRLLAAAEPATANDEARFASVCAPGYEDELRALVDRLAPRRATCVSLGAARDMDPVAPGLQPLCYAEGLFTPASGAPGDESRQVPPCTELDDGSWGFPSEADELCLRMLTGDALPEHCEVGFDDAAFVLERRPGASVTWRDQVRFNCVEE